MTRRFLRISRKLVFRPSQYRIRRQEQQQHHLSVEPNAADPRDQTQQCAEQDEQDWGAHPIAAAYYRAHDHGGKQRDDYDKPEHQHIIL